MGFKCFLVCPCYSCPMTVQYIFVFSLFRYMFIDIWPYNLNFFKKMYLFERQRAWGRGWGERPPIWLPVEHTAPEPKSDAWRSIDWATGALLQVKIFKNVVIEINFTCFEEINNLNNQWGRFILTFISFTKHIFFVFT